MKAFLLSAFAVRCVQDIRREAETHVRFLASIFYLSCVLSHAVIALIIRVTVVAP